MRFNTLLLLSLVGCLGPWQDEWDTNAPEADTDTDTDADADTDTDTDTDADTDTEPPVEYISAPIDTNTTWTADTEYILTANTKVFVDALLTIEAGTVIKGEQGAALVVRPGGRLAANGNRDNPIVFTSNQPVGSRAAGDWGGVVLLGDAPINVGTDQIDGIDELEGNGEYGGDDVEHNCGSMQYVRIEFPGFNIGAGNELNGLTLGGCGSDTDIHHVQVHATLDDGVELFGGNANLHDILITRPGDDGLDWDQGWTGMAQRIIVHMGNGLANPEAEGDRGIEADSKFVADFQSRPTIYNMTIIGNPDATAVGQRGIVLRENTGANLYNFVVTGFQKAGLDIRDENSSTPATIAENLDERTTTQAGTNLVGTDTLTLTHSLFFNNAVDGAAEDIPGNDHGLEEDAWLRGMLPGDTGSPAVETFNKMGDDDANDPGLFTQTLSLTNPNYVPPISALTALQEGAATPPDNGFFDPALAFRGAILPGTTGPDVFYDGWAAFPEN